MSEYPVVVGGQLYGIGWLLPAPAGAPKHVGENPFQNNVLGVFSRREHRPPFMHMSKNIVCFAYLHYNLDIKRDSHENIKNQVWAG